MPTNEMTKEAIARALRELAQTRPFGEISVQDIVRQCKVSRKTFYNHFEDKYQLVNWIFNHEIGNWLVAETTLEDWPKGSLALCRYLRENRVYYKNVLHFEGQNNLKEYLYALTEQQIKALLQELGAAKTISPEDLSFIIHFYYHAFIGELSVWVRQNMEDSPEHIVERWEGMVDRTLENFVEKFAKKDG